MFQPLCLESARNGELLFVARIAPLLIVVGALVLVLSAAQQ